MSKEIFIIRKETPWLLKCKAECMRESALVVEKAYKNFFNGSGFPKFKSKKDEQSFPACRAISSKQVKIIFFGHKIKYRTSGINIEFLELNKIKRCVFKRDICGDYWATCLIELPGFRPLPELDKTVGIDLGIKNLAITSDGEIFKNNKYLINSQFKLRTLQRKLAKTKKGGKNRDKLRIKVAKLYRKSVRQKEHYYHKITNKLINDNQVIILESLRVKNMLKNHKLARNISDASWGLLTSMLEYKAGWYGREIIKIGTFFPSSKSCSGCGNTKDTLLLSERTYICECCGLSIDRDINAAINIRNEGLRISGLPMEDTYNSKAYEIGSNSLIIKN